MSLSPWPWSRATSTHPINMHYQYSKYYDDPIEGFDHETAEHGRMVLTVGARPWNVRMVFRGESFGLRDMLEHGEDDPMVEFFDRRHARPGHLGQFVSSYYASTLTRRCEYNRDSPPLSQTGLNLHGGVPEWSVCAEDMANVMNWLEELGYPDAPHSGPA